MYYKSLNSIKLLHTNFYQKFIKNSNLILSYYPKTFWNFGQPDICLTSYTFDINNRNGMSLKSSLSVLSNRKLFIWIAFSGWSLKAIAELSIIITSFKSLPRSFRSFINKPLLCLQCCLYSLWSMYLLLSYWF